MLKNCEGFRTPATRAPVSVLCILPLMMLAVLYVLYVLCVILYSLNRVLETAFATWGRSTVVRVKCRQKYTVRAGYFPSVFNTPHPLKIYTI